jgi:hypothetical protein
LPQLDYNNVDLDLPRRNRTREFAYKTHA